MFKYNNNHIFTGYLKQLLSSVNLPTCKIYTTEFDKYLKEHGKEDPRILESFDTVLNEYGQLAHSAVCINYLKNNELYNYFSTAKSININDRSTSGVSWKRSNGSLFHSERASHGLTRSLYNHSRTYDTETHEYLGEYLRFLRDYYDLNLMSLYNCFNDKIYNNIYYKHRIKIFNTAFNEYMPESSANPRYIDSYSVFDSTDPSYRLYAIPVKLFAEYTIAIDCSQSIEMFCGLYNTNLELSNKAEELASKTYLKINHTSFNRPFLYDKLNIDHWPARADFLDTTASGLVKLNRMRTDIYTRWDITNREKDLKLFIKVPVSCKSSITILEGDYRGFNDFKYWPVRYNNDGAMFDKNNPEHTANNTKTVWNYSQNHTVLNFRSSIDLNSYDFKPISKLQLLAFNTGESYPFSDRLVEYLVGSAITSMDDISDNIKRAQKVMEQNNSYFMIEGVWEDKMQNILYDYVINSGPIVVKNGKLVDKHSGNNPKNYGYHPRLGHTTKSTMYDVLGYVDKDTEKLYSSWKKEDNVAKIKNNIQNIDIYNGLYDI